MKRNRSVRTVIAAGIAVLLSFTLAGCSSQESGGTAEDMAAVEPAPARDGTMALPEQETGGDEATGDRLVIRTKTMRLEVDSTTDAVEEIRDLTRSYEGTVSNMRIATGDDWVYHYDEVGNVVGDGAAVRGWVTVKVPTDSYEDFVNDVGELGEIIYQSESTDDVTQQHVDMSARLENLQAQEERLREFFEAAEDVEDMLAVEQELGRVRGEIESLDAQITYLERQAAMATVSVELTEPDAVVEPPGQSWGFLDAITEGIRGAARVLTVTLTLVIATSPIWILGLVLFFPIRALVRRRRAASAAKAAAARPAYAPQYPPPAQFPPPTGPAPDSAAEPVVEEPQQPVSQEEQTAAEEPTGPGDDEEPGNPDEASENPPRE